MVDGHFEKSNHSFPAKCEVVGCKNNGIAFWYRGVQFAALPEKVTELYDSAYSYG